MKCVKWESGKCSLGLHGGRPSHGTCLHCGLFDGPKRTPKYVMKTTGMSSSTQAATTSEAVSFANCIHRDRNNYEDRGSRCGCQARVYQCAIHGKCVLRQPAKVTFADAHQCKGCADVELKAPPLGG